ncbi:MAG: sporulation integral membrane protein YtvI [Lachnospiraceae bacterium]|nr:sporulation integral membrane protein YtvI [Lachnospiraceae bacterium]
MKKWQILWNIIFEIFIFLTGFLLLIWLVPKLLGFFWPFVASWILALLAAPLCSFLEKHIRLNKHWASAFVIILVLVILAGAGYFMITRLGKELISFLSDTPMYYAYFQKAIKMLGMKLNGVIAPISSDFGNQVQVVFDDLLSQMGSVINEFAPQSVSMLGSAAANVTSGLIGSLVMILSAYFFIADRDKMKLTLSKWLPDELEEQYNNIKGKLMAAMGGFVLAQLKIMGIVFVILMVGFLILKSPYAFLLALLISFLDLLPVLGTGTVLIPWAVIVLVQGNFHQCIILIVLYVVCLLARQLLQPKIIGDSIGMDTLPTLVLIYTGYKLRGMSGMILALLIGTVVVTLYRLGVFDGKIKRLRFLIDEYMHYDDNLH